MKRLLAPFLTALGLLALPAAAQADDSTSLSAECTIEGGVSCDAACDVPDTFGIQCSATAEGMCSAKLPSNCTGTASASCTGSCDVDCEAKCTADPPSFSCAGECNARVEVDCMASVDANCTASCMSDANQASCTAMCKASATAGCKGSGSVDCDAKCMGTTGSVDCKGSCSASCNGRCTADLKVQCADPGYVRCKGDLDVSCESNLKVSCHGGCSAQKPVLVCSGQIISQDDIDKLKAYFNAHFYANASASGSSSCTDGTCMAQGQAQASVGTKGCSAAPVRGHASSPLYAAGLVGLVYGASRIRRRRAR